MPLYQESSHLTRLSITKLYAQSPVCEHVHACARVSVRACEVWWRHSCHRARFFLPRLHGF